MSSWLNFMIRANTHSSRVHQARNAGKTHPLLQCRPYGISAPVDNNPLRLVQGVGSRVKVTSKKLSERSSDMGLRGRRCVPIADATPLCLVILSQRNRADWLSFRDSSADSTSDGAQGMPQVACNTSNLYNPRLRMSRSVSVNSHPVSRGKLI
jgi:hypothetical protein